MKGEGVLREWWAGGASRIGEGKGRKRIHNSCVSVLTLVLSF